MLTNLLHTVKTRSFIKISFSFLFSFLIIITTTVNMNGQVYDGTITLTTQSEVDTFSYSRVSSLIIREKAPGGITNLLGLSELKSVTEKLEISDNASITTLNGLSNLVEIYSVDYPYNRMRTRGVLIISNNNSLENIDALSGLKTVGSSLIIRGNDALKNLLGLSELKSVTEKLEISDNASITTLNGLSNLVEVYGEDHSIEPMRTRGDLIISNNNALENIDALSGLKTVAYSLTIRGNEALKNLDGLKNLSKFLGYEGYGGVWIEENNSLTNLDGLSEVMIIEGVCIIRNNPLLTSFCGLYKHFKYGYYSSWEVSGNGLNPSPEDIINGGPCSPGVFTGDIILVTQSQVDAFNYYEVDGNIWIREAFPGLIQNLNGLNELKVIKKDLNITYNTNITNLNGLNNLEIVRGQINIEQNPSLLEFCALYKLLSVQENHGPVSIKNNKDIPSIEEIIKTGPCGKIYIGDLRIGSQEEVDTFDYTKIIGNLRILGYEPFLINNLNGLSELKSVTGSLEILNNHDLGSLNGLENLVHIANLDLGSNFSVSSISALKNLSFIERTITDHSQTINSPGEIRINEEWALHSLDGLSGITSLGSLSIADCYGLGNLDGLSNLKTMEYYELKDHKPVRYNGSVYLNSNNLSNIDALTRITALSHLEISLESSLTNLNGLSSLSLIGSYNEDSEFIPGDLIIYDNYNIRSYCGLFKLFSTMPEYWQNWGTRTAGGGWITAKQIIEEGPCTERMLLNAMEGILSGDAHLGSMTGSINPRVVYFDGFSGGVTFNVEIPSSSKNWYIWGRIYCMSSGGKNSFLLTIDNKKYVLGDNSIPFYYDQWYWDGNDGLKINLGQLSPGKHSIRVSGREPGKTLWIDQLMLTDHQYYSPQGFSSRIVHFNHSVLDGKFSGDARTGNTSGLPGGGSTRAVFFQGINGGVSFDINIPINVKNCYLWARMYYWNKGSANSFFINMDGKKYIIGDNDLKYNQWHWDGNDGAPLNIGFLSGGNHIITISGREPGLTLWIDSLIITNDPEFIPEGFTSTTSNIFINAMNGTFAGDARLGYMTGALNSRSVYFQGLNGGVSFNVNLPSSQKDWYLWARMYYLSSGGKNSFYLSADGIKFVLGDNDSKYNQWHWDGNNGAKINLGTLAAGDHTIMISGREPGLTLWVDQLLLTDDPNFNPSDALIKETPGADNEETAQLKIIPTEHELSQNYPNPFNPNTTIRYGMPAPGSAEINIYDITGQLVKALFSGEVEEGYHELVWDSKNNRGRAIHCGIYFCRLTARSSYGEYSKVIKMLLLK